MYGFEGGLCPTRQPRVNVPGMEYRRFRNRIFGNRKTWVGFPAQVVGVESRMHGDVLVWFGEDSAYTDPVDWWKSFTPYSKYAFSGVS